MDKGQGTKEKRQWKKDNGKKTKEKRQRTKDKRQGTITSTYRRRHAVFDR